MRVVKKINNNVAVCIDGDGHELIAFGKGIGFEKTPYELKDMSRIWRTYYGINSNYLALLNEIPEEIFILSTRIVDMARKTILDEINTNIVFTLADHINFAIERFQKNQSIRMPLCYDIAHLYEHEMDIGFQAVKMINETMHLNLSRDEAVSIALHFINAENRREEVDSPVDENQLIEDIAALVEKNFAIKIDQKGFNYSRFASHLQYLLKRRENDTAITSENQKLYESMKQEFQKTYACVQQIQAYLYDTLHWSPSDEELLYLMLHINRLCSREDCNR